MTPNWGPTLLPITWDRPLGSPPSPQFRGAQTHLLPEHSISCTGNHGFLLIFLFYSPDTQPTPKPILSLGNIPSFHPGVPCSPEAGPQSSSDDSKLALHVHPTSFLLQHHVGSVSTLHHCPLMSATLLNSGDTPTDSFPGGAPTRLSTLGQQELVHGAWQSATQSLQWALPPPDPTLLSSLNSSLKVSYCLTCLT